MIRDAEQLTDTLPATESRRRVQLACWAAHHRVNRGEAVAAAYLLQRAEEASVATPDLHGLILAVRTQAATLVGSRPGCDQAIARRAAGVRPIDRRPRRRRRRALLLSSRQAWVEGTLADVADVRDAHRQGRHAHAATRPPVVAAGARCGDRAGDRAR